MSDILAIHDFLRSFQALRQRADSIDPAVLHERAKLILCVVDGTPVQALLPASLVVNLERLMDLAGAREVRLARADEWSAQGVAELVFVDVRLAAGHAMVFATDTASETLAVRWSDFARSVRPVVGDFAEPPRDCVGAYRLSYRE